MLGRRSKNSAAAIPATTTPARLEALELTLLAVLPLLPPASRAIVRSSIAGFMDEDITTPPASLVPTRHAQLFRDTLRDKVRESRKQAAGPACRWARPAPAEPPAPAPAAPRRLQAAASCPCC